MLVSTVKSSKLFGEVKGEGSSARNSSARKNCSTPKSRLLNTIRADDQIYKTAQINFFKWINQIRADVNNIIICSKYQAIAIRAVDYFIIKWD